MKNPIKMQTNHLRFLLLLLTMSVCNIIMGASHHIYGRVSDCSTGDYLPFVSVQLLKPDSTVIAGVLSSSDNDKDPGSYRINSVANGKYILKFSMLGYDTKYISIDVNLPNRVTAYDMETVCLKERSIKLDEFNVHATKIKMVFRGDTIIYNADAFHLAEGSMLDALISQLPGTELRDDGRIFVNGKAVSSLIVNGRNFFSGNPKVALENLPAYTVDKVKVYNKYGDISELLGKKLNDDKSYVMDVHLKKDYSVGWITNEELALGTHNRYIARFFGLSFTNTSRIGLFGNLNNLNDKRRPGRSGDWKPEDLPDGLMSTKTLGSTYNYESTDHKFKAEVNGTYAYSNTDNRSYQTSRQFLSNYDLYGHARSAMASNDVNVSTDGRVTYRRKKVLSQVGAKFMYNKLQANRNSYSATFNACPNVGCDILDSLLTSVVSNEINQITLHTLEQISDNKDKQYGIFGEISETFNVFGDRLSITGDISYDKTRNDALSMSNLYFLHTCTTDRRNPFDKYGSRKLSINGKARYHLYFGSNATQGIDLDYTYNYGRNNVNNNHYRLDWLGETDYSVLPSTFAHLQDCMDFSNSYQFVENNRRHTFSPSFSKQVKFPKVKGTMTMRLTLPVIFINKSMGYFRKQIYNVNKSDVFFTPSVNISFDSFKGGHRCVILSAGLNSDIPGLINFIEITDDSNPLHIVKGNRRLENYHMTNARIYYGTERPKHKEHYYAEMSFRSTDNSLAYSDVYDEQTGVMTSMPMNIDGNWSINMGTGYGRNIDKTGKMMLDNKFTYNYNHSVDYASYSGQSSLRSVVYNHSFDNNLKLEYKLNAKAIVSLKSLLRYSHVEGKNGNIHNFNSFDYSYGISAVYNLPWAMQLSTTLMEYSHRGYLYRTMNTDDLVWNVQASISVMKGKLTFILDGFDLLSNLSNIRHVINSQGRTETITNVIPQYVMLRAQYKFNYQPKKRK